MIHSLFIANSTGEVYLEKHWKKVVQRSICDLFYEQLSKAPRPCDISPVIKTPHHYIVNICKNEVFFIAVTVEEVSPLFVIEFLYRVVNVIQGYFSGVNETIIKDNIVQLYELLDEMLDNGFPLATELNILQELIRPPTLFRSLADTVTGRQTGISGKLPTGQLSNIPWRKAEVKYVSNEAYFDVIEEIDAIIDRAGSVIMSEVQGYIDCQIKLSGVPDVVISFENSRVIDDVSFHPCVRYRNWETDRVFSFVPPDGEFRLVSYLVNAGGNNLFNLPIRLKHSVSYRQQNSRIELVIQPQIQSDRTLENVRLETEFPRTTTNVTLTASVGKFSFNAVTKKLSWDVGKVTSTMLPTIKGTIDFQKDLPLPENNPIVNFYFDLTQQTLSGLRVQRVDLRGVAYKAYKGIKYSCKSGKYQIRT